MYTKKIETLRDFQEELSNNPSLQESFKSDPVAAANNIPTKSPLSTDVWIYRIIVISLGIVIISIVVGTIILIGGDKIKDDKEVPTILTAIGSAAIGALAGLLAPSPNKV